MALSLTYLDLKKEAAFHAGYGRTNGNWSADQLANLTAFVEAGLRQFYFPLSPDPAKPAHRWSFFYPADTLSTTAAYATGTVTVAAGVVTLVGGIFPSWAAQGELTINGVTYAVDTRDGNTQITLEDTSVAQATAVLYSLGRPAYDLPANYGGVIGPMTYPPGINNLYAPVEHTSERELMRKRQNYPNTGRPRWFAIRPKPFVESAGQAWEILFHPTPDAAYDLSYRYKVVPTASLTDGEYPLGGTQHAETILASVLAVVDEQLNDGQGLYPTKFRELLLASIKLDQAESTPDTLGYNADRSDRVDGYTGITVDPATVVTYNGQAYYD